MRLLSLCGNLTQLFSSSKENIHYIAAFAICVLIFFLVPYTFMLLFGYHLQSCSSKREFRWFNKFKPLLDVYYAPYHST